MFRRLIILGIIVLTVIGYIYLPNYNHKVTIIIDTIRIDTSVIYLGILLILSFFVLHWLLALIKWLRNVPSAWQKYRHVKRLEKHQKLRDTALIAYLEGKYETAENHFKQCNYYQTELEADSLFAAKMAALQKAYTRAEKYIDSTEHKNNPLAILLLQCQIHKEQKNFALIIAAIKQYHRSNKANSLTISMLLETYMACEDWAAFEQTLTEQYLKSSDKAIWQQYLHRHKMQTLLEKQCHQACIHYYQQRSYQEQQELHLLRYFACANIMAGNIKQALAAIPKTEDLHTSSYFCIIQILAQYPFTHPLLKTWLADSEQTAWAIETLTLMSIAANKWPESEYQGAAAPTGKNLEGMTEVEKYCRSTLIKEQNATTDSRPA